MSGYSILRKIDRADPFAGFSACVRSGRALGSLWPFLVASILLGIAACGGMPGHPVASPQRLSAKPSIELPFRVIPQIGHGGVAHVAASADGTRFASWDSRVVKVWDIETGILLRSITPAAEISTVGFAGTSQKTVIVSRSRAELWDIEKGTLEDSFDVPLQRESLVALSRDGGQMLTAQSEAPYVRLWDVTRGTVAAATGESVVSLLAFTNDDRIVTVANEDAPEIRIYDLSLTELAIYSGLPDYYPLAISNSGRTVVYYQPAMFSDLYIWDVNTGRLLNTFDPGDVYPISGTFSEDESRLLTSHAHSPISGEPSVVKEWDLNAKHLRRSLSHPGLTEAVYLAGDQSVLSSGNDFHVWSPGAHAPSRVIHGHATHWIHAVSVSGDGKVIATNGMGLITEGDDNGSLCVWDLNQLRPRWTVQNDSTKDEAIVSASGALVLAAVDEVHLYDAQSGSELQHWPGLKPIAISKDDRMVALATRFEDKLQVVDVATGKVLSNPSISSFLNGGAFLSDGLRLLTGAWEGLELRETFSGELIHRFGGHRCAVASVSVTPDEQIAASTGTCDSLLNIWRVPTGEQIARIERSATNTHVELDPSGRVALVAKDGIVERLSLPEGNVLERIESSPEKVTALSASRDHRFVAIGRRDGTTRIIGAPGGDAVTLVAIGNEWLVYTDDGYFDASRTGGDLVAAIQNGRPFLIDQLAVRNNRPDLILERLGVRDEERIAHWKTLYERRARRLGLDPSALTLNFDQAPSASIVEAKQQGEFVDLSMQFRAEHARLVSYTVFVNGVPLPATGPQLTGNETQLRRRIKLSRGQNLIEVSALNSEGVESLRDHRHFTYEREGRGILHFIAFGVSRYRDARLNLRYAHKDALDLARVFERGAGRYDEVRVHTFVDDAVTVQSIRDAKRYLHDAGVDDTVVLFVAGHGTHDRNAAADYFYVTHDTDLKRLPETAAKFELFEELLQGILPRRKLFLIDTCESGERYPNETSQVVAAASGRGLRMRSVRGLHLGTRRSPPRRFLFDDDRYIYNDLVRRTGAVVLSASRGTEFSYEQDRLANGVFTEAVIRALTTTEADVNGDAWLTTEELRGYVTSTVSRLTGDLQHPTVDRDNKAIHIALPIIKGFEAD